MPLGLSSRGKGAHEAPAKGDGPRGGEAPGHSAYCEGMKAWPPFSLRKEAPNGIWSSMTQGPAFPYARSLGLGYVG